MKQAQDQAKIDELKGELTRRLEQSHIARLNAAFDFFDVDCDGEVDELKFYDIGLDLDLDLDLDFWRLTSLSSTI